MDFNLIYMPTFRVRQQEIIVLKSFDFGNNSYPLLEIVKEHDRARKDDSQKSFGDIHNELINEIKALRGDLLAGKIAVNMDGQKVTSKVSSIVDKVASNSYAKV